MFLAYKASGVGLPVLVNINIVDTIDIIPGTNKVILHVDNFNQAYGSYGFPLVDKMSQEKYRDTIYKLKNLPNPSDEVVMLIKPNAAKVFYLRRTEEPTTNEVVNFISAENNHPEFEILALSEVFVIEINRGLSYVTFHKFCNMSDEGYNFISIKWQFDNPEGVRTLIGDLWEHLILINEEDLKD